jgi:hypothetical protein
MRSVLVPWLAVAVLVVAAGGCVEPAGGGEPSRVRPCEEVKPAAQCDALVSLVAEELDVPDEVILALEIVPEPTVGPDGILQIRSGGGFTVRIRTARGVEDRFVCPGVSGAFVPACMDDPRLAIGSPMEAYHDHPEGATPLPRLEPEALAAAETLRIAARSIPIARTGVHEVVLGTATLPNGYLTAAEAALADPWPAGVRLTSDGIRLEVRPTDPARPPLWNQYVHGWWPGLETIEAVLVFDVRRFEPGATLEVRDVVVG